MVYDSYSSSNRDASFSLYGASFRYFGQSFKNASETKLLQTVQFYVWKEGSPTGNVTVEIYAHTGTFGTDGKPTGSPIAVSNAIDASALGAYDPGAYTTFTFPGTHVLSGGTAFVAVLHFEGGDASNKVHIECDNSSPSHQGNVSTSTTGLSWGTQAQDLVFQINATEVSTTMGKIYNQDFENLSLAALAGQDGWTDDAGSNATVQNSTVFAGSQAVSMLTVNGTNKICGKTLPTGVMKRGKLSFRFRRDGAHSGTDNRVGVNINDQAGSFLTTLAFMNDGNFKYYNGSAFVTISAYSENTWYLGEIEWRGGNQFRFGIDGTFTSWVALGTGTTGVSKITLNTNTGDGGGFTLYVDDIQVDYDLPFFTPFKGSLARFFGGKLPLTTELYTQLDGDSRDNSGNKGHGSDTNVVYSPRNGLFRKGAKYNGSSSQTVWGNSVLLTGTDPFTLMFWAKTDSYQAQNAFTYVFDGSNKLQAQLYTAGALYFQRGAQYVEVTGFTDTVRWHHFVMTYDGSNIRAYIDGVLRGTTASAGSISATDRSLYIGSGGSTQWYNGSLCEVFLEKRTWSAEQIAAYVSYATRKTFLLPLKLWLVEGVNTITATLTETANFAASMLRTAQRVMSQTVDFIDNILGADLVVNGDFDTDTDWTKEGTVTISGGQATLTGQVLNSGIAQSMTIANGSYYELEYDVVSSTLTKSFYLSSVRSFGLVVLPKTAGHQRIWVKAINTTNSLRMVTDANETGNIVLDNVSLKLVQFRGFTALKVKFYIFTSTATFTATMVRTVGRVFSQFVSFTDQIIKGAVKLFIETSTFTDQVIEHALVKLSTFSETVNFTATLIRSAQREFSENASFAAVFASTASRIRIYTESITHTDTVSTSTSRSRVFTEIATFAATAIAYLNGIRAGLWRRVARATDRVWTKISKHF